MSNVPFHIEFGDLSESIARLALVWNPRREAVPLSISLYGPRCERARTLPSEFSSQASSSSNEQLVTELLVTEPCYWTPELPFLYDLHVEWAVRSHPHEKSQTSIPIGLRRWIAHKQSFYLNGSRTVLRGAAVGELTPDIIERAEAAGAALLMPPNDEAEIGELPTDSRGTPLAVDLRESGADFWPHLSALSWSASALIAVVDAGQILECEAKRIPGHLPLALAIYPYDEMYPGDQHLQLPGVIPNWARAYAVELGPTTRPPTWLAHCGRPVIAIRRGQSHTDVAEARAACDLLQAELAPVFDLAGYFVGP